MTPDEREAFGLSGGDEREISQWIINRMASILGNDGRGGSGVFVYLEDGQLAVLTARHVVIRCILTGEMTLLRTSQPGTLSTEPKAIRVDHSTDSALLIVDGDSFEGDALSFRDWTSIQGSLKKGMPVIASGIVGEWKNPDQTTRKIPLTKVLNYWTAIVDPDGPFGLIVCDVDESNKKLPGSFGGMSGGPLFSNKRRFLGINMGEIRDKDGSKDGELYITPATNLNGLYTPFCPAEPAPQDYMFQKARLLLSVVNKITQFEVPMIVQAEYFWSKSSPNTPNGRFGRIIGVQFMKPLGAERYNLNAEAVFYWRDSNTDEDRLHALQDMLAVFLEKTGFSMTQRC